MMFPLAFLAAATGADAPTPTAYYCYDQSRMEAAPEFKFEEVGGADKAWRVTRSDGSAIAAEEMPRKDPPQFGRGAAVTWLDVNGEPVFAQIDFSDVVYEFGPSDARLLLLDKADQSGKRYFCIPSAVALKFKGKDRPRF